MPSPPTPIVQVLYALPARQVIVELPYEPGMTAAIAVERSRLVDAYPSIAEQPLVVGVWGRQVEPEQRLEAGDRVEISRPLVADPRVMRRELVSDGRVMGGADAAARATGAPVRKKARE